MTPAEFKTLRESLGLPIPWVAEQTGVQKRTVIYWESGLPGRSHTPDDAAAMLIEIDRKLNDAAQRAVEQAKAFREKTGSGDIKLFRYKNEEEWWATRPDMKSLPLNTHSELLTRTLRALLREDFTVSIEYFDANSTAG